MGLEFGVDEQVVDSVPSAHSLQTVKLGLIGYALPYQSVTNVLSHLTGHHN